MKSENNKINKQIAFNIKYWRMRRELNQDELAERAGVNKNTIWKIETNQSSPSIETLVKIANGLRIPFEKLIDTSKMEDL